MRKTIFYEINEAKQVSQSYESFGKYILYERVAMGGMAEVYLGRNRGAGGIGKFLAIKRILPQFSEHPEFIDMFHAEAKIAVNLSHSNIVSIYEFGVEQEQFFLAMDYVEGRNLRQIINKMKKSGLSLSVDQALYIVKEVAAGLDHAHRCIDSNTGKPLNIIHRDMSPQNVMISFEGEVKIVDFGIAKAETQIETTRAGTLKGKFGYMSPEQAEGMTLDLRTDIFSLGILLWELLANDRLFIANNEVNTLRKIRECQVPSLRKINPSIPQELERIVNKALARDRNLRYQTSAVLHRELSRFLNRHYPDFSPQDFSVFIKTLFAGEILESRKKMVDYSKNFEIASTSAKVESPETAPSQPDQVPKSPPKSSTLESLNFSSPTSSQTNHSPGKNSEPVNPASSSTEDRTMITGSGSFTETDPSIGYSNEVISSSSTPSNSNSDFSEASVAKTGSTNFSSMTSSIGVPPPDMHRISENFWNQAAGKAKDRSSVLLTSLVGFIGIILIAAFLIPSNGGKLYSWFSGLWPKKEIKQIELTSVKKPSTHFISVSSIPSGATIFIDGVAQTEITPTALRLPEGRTFKISIQMDGYLPYSDTIHVRGPQNIQAVLKDNAMGYLKVIINGSGTLTLNGKEIHLNDPNQTIPVIADRENLLSVFDPVTKAGAQTKVSVSRGATRTVILNPRTIDPSSDASQNR